MESPRKLENQRWRDRGVHVVLRIAAEQNSGSTLAIVTTQPFLGPTARFERLLKRAAQFVNSSTPNSVTREIGEKSGTAAAGAMSRTA